MNRFANRVISKTQASLNRPAPKRLTMFDDVGHVISLHSLDMSLTLRVLLPLVLQRVQRSFGARSIRRRCPSRPRLSVSWTSGAAPSLAMS
jgi:hypothetical protein